MAKEQKPQVSSTEAQEAINEKAAQVPGLTPERVAEMMLLAELMKAPSAAELKKEEQENKRRLDNLKAEAEMEVEKDKRIESDQAYCAHRRKDGKMLFTGQVLTNGIAIVRCLRCQKAYVWTASEDERSQGLNFQDPDYDRCVSEEQLVQQEKVCPADPAKIRALGLPKVAARHEKYWSDRQVAAR